MTTPETRPSLLLRIRDWDDHAAWDEFVTLYRPIVCQMARRNGMQAADAEDLAQQVLWSLSQAIETFEPGKGPAKFRTWLKTIAKRAIINALTRGKPDRATGSAEVMRLLDAQPQVDDQTRELLDEYRREIFVTAAAQIRREFQPDTWQAFWATVVQQLPIDEVARQLRRSRGSVYTARSRVMHRLKERVQELDGDE